MVGGYVSVDNIINTVVTSNKPTYVKGSFELTKSLVNAKKPIIGVVDNTDAVLTYIGMAYVEDTSQAYISVFRFQDLGSMSNNFYTVTNKDIVTLIES